MRSELFEETLKQHKDGLIDELEQLGKHRQAQLVAWDIEQNESDYEFYFNAAWQEQQAIINNLKVQLNNMEQCYIQLKQEHNELVAFNTVQDRKQKAAEKVAEKYKRKVLMIADLLRDSADKDMTFKAIQTIIERVGEHV